MPGMASQEYGPDGVSELENQLVQFCTLLEKKWDHNHNNSKHISHQMEATHFL